MEVGISVPEKFLPLYQPFRHKAFHGGRGSAKSHSFGQALSIMSAQRKLRIGCGRQFQNSIRDSVKELIEQKIKDLNIRDGFKITDQEIIHRSTGSRFSFFGLERNPDSQKSLEGLDIFWGEEAHTFNEKSLEIIIPTVRAKGSEMWWSWNPRYRTDPVDNMFRGSVRPERSVVVEVGYEDNPYFFETELPAEMRFLKKKNLEKYKHVWRGGYDENSEARIFPNTRIGRLEVPEHILPRFGMDFGFSNDPNAVIKLYVLHETQQIYIAAEAFGRVPLTALADLVLSVPESDRWPIIADSARPETIDYLRGKGFSIHSATKGPGSIKNGINWLQGYDIVIDPDCLNMQEEARLYFWKLDPLGKPLSIPVDKYNHGWDAIRYAVEEESMLEEDDPDGGVVKVRR
jgi:phage terminase large subunit